MLKSEIAFGRLGFFPYLCTVRDKQQVKPKNDKSMKINELKDEEKVYTTCFNDGITFNASTEQIVNAIGEPQYRIPYDGDKTTREWDLELEDGTPFTIYDWKEYRDFGDDEVVEWHVGNDFRDTESKGKIVAALKEVGLK
jgi:hypothetical protein